MKTYKNLYPQIYTSEDLHTAYREARKGKRGRVEVAAFEFDMEHNLLQLQSELRDQTYRPGPYHNFYIREPKRRLAGVGFARLHLRRGGRPLAGIGILRINTEMGIMSAGDDGDDFAGDCG